MIIKKNENKNMRADDVSFAYYTREFRSKNDRVGNKPHCPLIEEELTYDETSNKGIQVKNI